MLQRRVLLFDEDGARASCGGSTLTVVPEYTLCVLRAIESPNVMVHMSNVDNENISACCIEADAESSQERRVECSAMNGGSHVCLERH